MAQHSWPSSEESALPRVEDLPHAEGGYDPERVEASFAAFYRHLAQLDSTLRTLEAVEAFGRQAAELRAELRLLRQAGWTQQPWSSPYGGGGGRSLRPAVPEALPRVTVEVVFLVVLAVALALASFSTRTVVLVMVLAWAIVFLVELVASRERASTFAPAARPAVATIAPEPEPEPEPASAAAGWSPAASPEQAARDEAVGGMTVAGAFAEAEREPPPSSSEGAGAARAEEEAEPVADASQQPLEEVLEREPDAEIESVAESGEQQAGELDEAVSVEPPAARPRFWRRRPVEAAAALPVTVAGEQPALEEPEAASAEDEPAAAWPARSLGAEASAGESAEVAEPAAVAADVEAPLEAAEALVPIADAVAEPGPLAVEEAPEDPSSAEPAEPEAEAESEPEPIRERRRFWQRSRRDAPDEPGVGLVAESAEAPAEAAPVPAPWAELPAQEAFREEEPEPAEAPEDRAAPPVPAEPERVVSDRDEALVPEPEDAVGPERRRRFWQRAREETEQVLPPEVDPPRHVRVLARDSQAEAPAEQPPDPWESELDLSLDEGASGEPVRTVERGPVAGRRRGGRRRR